MQPASTARSTLSGTALVAGTRIDVFFGSKGVGLYLEAYAELHAGLQIDPAYVEGILEVAGELHVAGWSASAPRVTSTSRRPKPFVISGQGLRQEIGVWKFKVTKCKTFAIGNRLGHHARPQGASEQAGGDRTG